MLILIEYDLFVWALLVYNTEVKKKQQKTKHQQQATTKKLPTLNIFKQSQQKVVKHVVDIFSQHLLRESRRPAPSSASWAIIAWWHNFDITYTSVSVMCFGHASWKWGRVRGKMKTKRITLEWEMQRGNTIFSKALSSVWTPRACRLPVQHTPSEEKLSIFNLLSITVRCGR